MNRQDFFMGGLALMLALLAIGSAVHNRDAYYRLPKIRWIDERWGRRVARYVYAVAGLVLLALGVLILSGWSFLGQ
ncbi:MAG: hypothetical protein GX575_27040 [Candidatus Anammoximicrobium sp.]|nr:hypothetical protein [Candidatus Anammoximicrobium sp.]